MIRLVLALWIGICSHAFAAPVVVKTGEHEGFTRLVLDYGTPVNWTVGRTMDGYELQLPEDLVSYDLTQAFKLIGKGRLAAIWADPETTALRLGIACACHAIPFEFRPGILVIDVRDGPPPKGSSFEQMSDGSELPALTDKPLPRPRPRPKTGPQAYVWTDLVMADLRVDPAAASQGRLEIAPSSDPEMEPLRFALLRQLSRGAAQGVIEIATTNDPPVPTDPPAKLPSVRIALGELPGLAFGTGLPTHADLGLDGERCIAADSLDFAAWGNGDPVSEQISGAMAGILGEFDKPDPKALTRAIRFQLYLGFGAEAQQLLKAFPMDLPDRSIWLSLASILDDTADDAPAFHGQTACDTPAALWAVLGNPAPLNSEMVHQDAVMLAFSALPVALRRHLGPRLADRFLALGDIETASAIRNTILRAPGVFGQDVALLDVDIDLANGNPAAAEAQLDAMLAEPGQGTAAALVALVTTRVAQDLPTDARLVTALEAILPEQIGSAAESEIRHALVLAQAASGRFDSAFAALPLSPTASADVWRLLAKIAVDDAVLAFAVLAKDQPRPTVAQETASILAESLLGFGLADAAQHWLGSSVDPVLQSRIHLARGDARGALDYLARASTPASLPLRAEALSLLGDQGAAQAYADAGDATGQRFALARQRDWSNLAAMDAEGWSPLIDALVGSPESIATGALARGHLLAARSTETRAAVADLLALVAAPTKSAP